MDTMLAIWLASGGFIGGFVQIMMAYQDSSDLSFVNAFYFANAFYNYYKEDLNLAGLIIGITVISILVLPGSILTILIASLMKLIETLWELFKFLFRKRKVAKSEQEVI